METILAAVMAWLDILAMFFPAGLVFPVFLASVFGGLAIIPACLCLLLNRWN